MNQENFVFTAMDWLAGIVAASIVTGAICYANSVESKARFYRYGWVDGAKATKEALRKQKGSKESK